ncbi:hypothetical protein H4R35_004366 [Dimargaris xerosporica]|nr:hypothetical protein H4R35_004366 [Dimargaris xerosporica]
MASATDSPDINAEQVTVIETPPPREPIIDYIILGLGACAFFVNLLAFLYLLKNRNYPPLKAKNIPLMTVALVSSFFWWLGDSHVNGLFGFRPPFNLCLMWGFWMRHVLGILTHLIVINYRLHLLRWLFVLKRPGKGWRFYVPVILISIPPALLGIVGVVLPRNYTLIYSTGLARCKHNSLIKYLVLSYSVFLILLIWVQSFLLRNIKSSFNEFRSVVPACIGTTVVVTLNATFVLFELHHTIAGRAVLGVANIVACQLFFWCIMGPPLRGCMFHRQEYLTRFYSSLERDGLRQSLKAPPQPLLHGSQSTEKQRGVSMVGTVSTMTISPAHSYTENVPQHTYHQHQHPPTPSVPFPPSSSHWSGSTAHPRYDSDATVRVVQISPVSDMFGQNDPHDMFVLVPSKPSQPPYSPHHYP